MVNKILIRKINTPPEGNLDEDIDFICKSLGYFAKRDKNEIAGKIFRFIVRKNCNDLDGLTSDDIADNLNMSRGAIVHHLNNFISAGLIIREKNTYKIRCTSVQKSIEEIKQDIDRIFEEMLKIAKDIDNNLGYYYR